MRKYVSVILALSVCLMLAACGDDTSAVINDDKEEKEEQIEDIIGEEEVVDAKSELARQNVYSKSEVSLKGIDMTSCTFVGEGTADKGAYYIVQDNKDTDPVFYYIELDNKGNATQVTELDSPIDPDFSNIFDILKKNKVNPEALLSPLYSGFTLNNDGNIECFLTILLGFHGGEEQFVPFEVVWDKEGSCISMDLIPLFISSEGYMNEFFIDDDNNLIILYSDYADDGDDAYCDNYCVVFDENRKKGTEVNGYDVRDWFYGFVDMYSLNGKTYVVFNDYEDYEEVKYYQGVLDLKTLEVSDKTQINLEGLDKLSIEGVSDKGELIFSNNLCLKKWSQKGDSGEFLNFVNSDLRTGYLFNIVSLKGTDSFYAISYEDDILKIFKYDYAEPDSIPVNKVITLAVNGFAGDIIEQIYDFNTSDNGYRVVVVDISEYTGVSSYDEVYDRLKNKIVSGDMPDIIYVDDSCGLDFRFLAKEGHFADIGELMKNDPDINMDDYCTNVFQAAKIRGSLYYVVPNFEIYTYYGMKDYVGEYNNWTVDEFIEFADSLDKNTTIFDPFYNRETFINQCMCASGYSWIDADQKICDFNDPSFMKLVGFAQTLSEYTDYESERYNEYSADPTAFGREGRFMIEEIYGVDAQYLFTNGFYTFDSPIHITGFPSADRKGTTIVLEKVAVLNNDSEDLDAAWSFAKLLLSEKYQNRTDMGLYPVLKTALYDRCMEGMRADDRVTKEDFEELYDILTTSDRLYFTDYELTNLVTSTVMDGCSSRKTPEQIATDVQKAVSEYLESK